jgi:hypothetical protein
MNLEVPWKAVYVLIIRTTLGFNVKTLFVELGPVIGVGSERCKFPHTAL